LGSHLYNKLEQLGHTVLRGDRLGNISEQVDYIIDCAAYGNFYDQNDLNEIVNVNYIRVLKLLKNVTTNVKGIILTSTSSVTLPMQSPYSASKTLMEFAGLNNKLPVVIARPYTVYGPGDSPKHFIPKVFDSCLAGTPIPLSPEATHDYVWIKDVVDTYLKALEQIDKFKGKIIDIGTGKPISNSSIVVMIEHVTGKKANISRLEQLRFYDMKNWKSDNPLPKFVHIEEGLNKIYDDIKQRLKEKITYN